MLLGFDGRLGEPPFIVGAEFEAPNGHQYVTYIKEQNNTYIDDILIWDDAGSGLTGNLGGKAYTMTVIRPTSDVIADFTRSTEAMFV